MRPRRFRTPRTGVFAVAFALGLVPTSASEAKLELEVSGCAAQRADGTCELDAGKRQLRLWFAGEAERVELFVDGTPAEFRRKSVAGGTLLTLSVKRPAALLRVAATLTQSRASGLVALAERARHTALETLEQRRQSGADLKEEGPGLNLAALPEPLRARALDILARRELARGHTAGAIAQLSQAEAQHRRHGALSAEVRDAFAIAYAQTLLTRDFAAARRELAGARRRTTEYAEGRADLAYYEGLLASETGDFSAAHAAFLDAEMRSERLGRDDQVALVQRARALLLTNLGRLDEARAVLARTRTQLAPEANACQRAHVLTNVGWVALRSAQRMRDFGVVPGSVSDLRAELEREADSTLRQAIALYRHDCPNPVFLDNARSNLAELSLLRNELATTREQLAARGDVPADARGAASWEDIAGSLALAESEPEKALAHFEREIALATSGVLPRAAWQGTLGRAQALEQLGRSDEAAQQYAASEALLDEQSARLPFGQGRESFLATRAPGARQFVDLLLRSGDVERAFRVARRARARALVALRWSERVATLEASERQGWQEALAEYARRRAELDALSSQDWQLSSEQLALARSERTARHQALESALDRAQARLGAQPSSEPLPISDGELALLLFPVRSGYAVFAADSKAVTAYRLQALPEDALARAVLQPLLPRLAQIRRLRVLPYGPLKRVDVHALPVDGRPLGLELPVVYGVDVPLEVAPSLNLPHASPLVVADPAGDLRSARLEARSVGERLEILAGETPRMFVGEAAARASVLAALTSARTFHFAGHASYSSRGWSNAMVLAAGSTLTVTDILSLHRVPQLVVLASCETGRSDTAIEVENIGIAEAFVLAGAEFVIASARRLADVQARELVEAFYADGSALSDAPLALSRAQARVAARHPRYDWASLRVITR